MAAHCRHRASTTTKYLWAKRDYGILGISKSHLLYLSTSSICRQRLKPDKDVT